MTEKHLVMWFIFKGPTKNVTSVVIFSKNSYLTTDLSSTSTRIPSDPFAIFPWKY